MPKPFSTCFFFFLLQCEQFECKPPQPTQQVVKLIIKLLGPDNDCLWAEDEGLAVVPTIWDSWITKKLL